MIISSVALYFVDKRVEISNLEIIRDMDKIVKLEEVLVNSKLLSP